MKKRMRRGLADRKSTAIILSVAFAWVGIASQGLAGDKTAGLAANANFSVSADSQDLAEEILSKADKLRVQIAKKWLGETIPDGFGPVSMNVDFDGKDYSRTWLLGKNSKRTMHTMWIHTTPQKLESALAHEITHVVLANRYPNLPPFAQEGVASFYDDDERKAIRRNVLRWFAKTDRWPNVERLLSAETVNPSNQSDYTMAVSVTEFLLSRSDNNHEKFFNFAISGQKTQNWDAALSRYYAIRDVQSLQADWQVWAKSNVRKSEYSGATKSATQSTNVSRKSIQLN